MPVAFHSILMQAGLAMAPLQAITTPDQGRALLRKLGYDLPPGVFGEGLSALSARAGELIDAVGELAEGAENGGPGTGAAIDTLLARLVATVSAIRDLHAQIEAAGGALPGLADLPRRLTDFLALDFLDAHRPHLHAILHVLGLIEHEPNAPPGQPTRLINWNRFGLLVTEPGRLANDVYRWDSDFDVGKLLSRLERLMRLAGLPGGRYPQTASTQAALGNTAAGLPELRLPIFQRGLTPEAYSQFGIAFSPAEAQGAEKAGLALLPYIMGSAELDFPVGDRHELVFESTADLRTVGLVIRPPLSAEGLLNLSSAFRASVAIREKPAQAEEIILIGSRGGTRLAVQGLGITWFVDGPPQELDLGFEAEAQVLRLVVAPGESDGFLGEILSGLNVKAEARLALGMTLASGFTLKGGVKLAVELATQVDLGPVRLVGLRVSLAPADDHLRLEAGTTLRFTVGPVAAVAENVGLRSDLCFQPGNLGPADLAIRFKPPSGIGLSVDAGGVVAGGGFLFHDEARGLYAGAMQLSLRGQLTLKAFGLISTRMPDGRRGYSLIVFITAEDFRPIPLGLGFTLLGIGGMVGVHRTFDENVLRAGLGSGALAALLFPRDPVGNAEALIQSLSSAFPARQGSYLLGLMAKIGWFTPTLVTMDLALILEFGARQRLLALGRISALLPSAQNDLIRLNLDAMGVIDFDAGTVAVDAELVDSRLAHKFPITGSAALRAGFGEGPGFVLAVGGFHPRFAAPTTVPALKRVTIALSSGNNPRLVCQGYFAITSNSVQYGAEASLYAAAAGFSVEGHVGYDVLVQLAPLHFIAEFHAKLQLRRGSRTLFMVALRGALEGPRPLRVSGTATFEILWFDVTVRFDATLVKGEPPPLPPAVDVLGLLKQALAAPTSWRTQRSPTQAHGVALRSLAPAAAGAPIALDPLGQLVVTQQVVPLNTGRDIELFGSAPVAGERRFRLSASLSNVPLPSTPVQAPFAPAQFFAMSDDEKLAAQSFESMEAGRAFGDAQATFEAAQVIAAPLEYAVIAITLEGPVPPPAAPPAPASYAVSAEALPVFARSGAAARAPARRVGRARFRNEAVAGGARLAATGWAIGPIGEGAAAPADPGLRTFSDFQAAVSALNRAGARWQVVPIHEEVV